MITHFHSDYFGDLHILVDKICRSDWHDKVKIIAPKNALKPYSQRDNLQNLFKSKSIWLAFFVVQHQVLAVYPCLIILIRRIMLFKWHFLSPPSSGNEKKFELSFIKS